MRSIDIGLSASVGKTGVATIEGGRGRACVVQLSVGSHRFATA